MTKTSPDETNTCGEEGAKQATDLQKAENGEQQPPEKRKRLSNREYKKLMKGQNKVSVK